VQDQWTLKRLTLSGAIRYDHATSHYPGTCIGGSGNEPYVPVQVGGSSAGKNSYCTPDDTDGVSYNDLTRAVGRGAGTSSAPGKTVSQVEHGQLSVGCGNSTASMPTPTLRSVAVNEYVRSWTGRRRRSKVDCDLLNFNAQDSGASGGDICGGPGSVFAFPSRTRPR
jgi:hypothetical protein